MADALAALRIWRVHLRIGGYVFTIPPHPARDWLIAMLGNGVLDLLDDAGQAQIDELVDDGVITMAQLSAAEFDAIAAAAGRDWPPALRLASALQNDALRGELAMAVDLDTVSIAAVLDAVYALLVRWETNKEKRAKFDLELNAPAPLPGQSPRSAAEQARQQTRDALALRQSSGTPSAG